MYELSRKDIIKKYAEYCANKYKDGINNNYSVGVEHLGFNPSAISDITAGIRYIGIYEGNFYDANEKEKENLSDKAIVYYSIKPHKTNFVTLCKDRRSAIDGIGGDKLYIKGSGAFDFYMVQICEDGYYEMRFDTNYQGKLIPWNSFIRFYSNNSIKQTGYDLDKVKRDLLKGYSYYPRVTRELSGNNFPKLVINPEELFMLYNKLYRLGLARYFQGSKLEITNDDRNFYKRQEEQLKDEKASDSIKTINEETITISDTNKTKKETPKKDIDLLKEQVKLLQRLLAIAPEIVTEEQKELIKTNQRLISAYNTIEKYNQEEKSKPDLKEMFQNYYAGK